MSQETEKSQSVSNFLRKQQELLSDNLKKCHDIIAEIRKRLNEIVSSGPQACHVFCVFWKYEKIFEDYKTTFSNLEATIEVKENKAAEFATKVLGMRLSLTVLLGAIESHYLLQTE